MQCDASQHGTNVNICMMSPPHCQAQASFIKSVRSAIDSDAKKFLQDKDWRNVQPKSPRHGLQTKKQFEVASFYVKPVACFVPHLIIPGHVPVCPRCDSADRVDTLGSYTKWTKVPKILFGTHSHRCLDTKFYWCGACRRRFAGCDKRSMQLSAKLWLGFFPFNLSDRFAVDEELCSFIVASANEQTSKMFNKLQQQITDTHYDNYQCCLHLVRSKRIRSKVAFTGNSDGQRRIDSMLPKRGNLKESDGTRRLRLARDRLTTVQ